MSSELTTSNIRVEGVNDSPSIGSANLSKEEVDKAIDALIMRMTPDLLGLIAKNSDANMTLEKRNGSDRIIVYPFSQNKLINPDSLEDKNPENSNYLLSTCVDIKKIQDRDALDHLLIKLRSELFDLGYTDESNLELFYIIFEKGILETDHSKISNYWHRDRGFKTSVTTCFSSIENWNTQVLDEKKMPDEKKDFIKEHWKNKLMNSYNVVSSDTIFQSTLESYGMPALHGFLYDAMNIFHRAPKISDLKGQEIGINDYRFFIRYQQYN